ncbi:MAG TPA: hypothetical protein VMR18_00225 [Candidatus Saccharimonadales bacterium]|nr:hypothetical protein [Candidatus Saccharimonadales bacterium]
MSKFDELLNKDVTRKEFLTTVTIAVTSLFGLSTIMGVLTKNHPSEDEGPGYGSQNYGR